MKHLLIDDWRTCAILLQGMFKIVMFIFKTGSIEFQICVSMTKTAAQLFNYFNF